MTPKLLSRAIATKQLCRGRGMVNCKKQFAAVLCRHNHASESCKPMGAFFAGQFCPTPWTRTWKFISRTTVVLVIQYPVLPPKNRHERCFASICREFWNDWRKYATLRCILGVPKTSEPPKNGPKKMLKNTFIQISKWNLYYYYYLFFIRYDFHPTSFSNSLLLLFHVG